MNKKKRLIVNYIKKDGGTVEEMRVALVGIPYPKRKVSIISVAVDAPASVISAISGKLGMLDGVSAKTVYSKIAENDDKEIREKVLKLGISQISGGSRTSVGGYAEEEKDNSAQFDVSDNRTLDEVVKWLMELGYIPSFCTACYREGRTGDRFMSLCKSGQIQNCCHPNALMTLKEYLMDYAKADTKEVGDKLIIDELKNILNEKVRQIVLDNLKKIEEGSRDFRF